MYIDARSLPSDKILEADVCIIGGGASGITLAREFIDHGARVLLLESGGFNFDAATERLYRGIYHGPSPTRLDTARLRYFGGSTNHWAGICRPLAPDNFRQRSWLPHSGWPFGYAELEPFYRRANVICELGPFDYRPLTGAKGAVAFAGHDIITATNRRSPPTRFGRRYRADLKRARNVHVLLHANVTKLVTAADGKHLDHLRVRCLGGQSFKVQAGQYVLATGGIENARLLLASRQSSHPNGLGNAHNLVGRYYMDTFMWTNTGVIVAQRPLAGPAYSTVQWYHRTRKPGGILVMSEAAQREAGVGEYSAMLDEASEPQALRSWDMIGGSLRARRYRDVLIHFGNILRGFNEILAAGYDRVTGHGRSNHYYKIFSQWEQVPNPDSRVTLTTERDALGMPRPRVDWRTGELDKRTLVKGMEALARELGRRHLGRVYTSFHVDEPWPSNALVGNEHLLGTTRMHVDPKQGVVDADCRLHGMANFYVIGNSVFPTISSSNPTLTNVALTLRLADHLKRVLKT